MGSRFHGNDINQGQIRAGVPVSKVRSVAFSLIPVMIVLLMLEVIGRVIYPFDADARAEIKAERDSRLQLSYLSATGHGKEILTDIHRQAQHYVPFLGWIGQPNMTLPTLHTNDLGFRDAPIEPRRSNERRVLVLGGSTAWGLGASANEHTVSGALEARLNRDAQGVRYRVMSGAYPAWQSRHELITLMEFYDRFDPDVVIALTGYNDLFTLTYGSDGELHTRPESRMLARAVDESLRPMTTLQALRKVAGSLGIWRIVIHFREQVAAAKPREAITRYEKSMSDKVTPLIRDRYLTMADFTRRHGARLIIALQPDIFTTRKPMTAEELAVKHTITESQHDISATYSRYRADLLAQLNEQLPAADVAVIDLAGVLDATDEPVFIDACHLNDAGYHALAKSLQAQLTQQVAAWQ